MANTRENTNSTTLTATASDSDTKPTLRSRALGCLNKIGILAILGGCIIFKFAAESDQVVKSSFGDGTRYSLTWWWPLFFLSVALALWVYSRDEFAKKSRVKYLIGQTVAITIALWALLGLAPTRLTAYALATKDHLEGCRGWWFQNDRYYCRYSDIKQIVSSSQWDLVQRSGWRQTHRIKLLLKDGTTLTPDPDFAALSGELLDYASTYGVPIEYNKQPPPEGVKEPGQVLKEASERAFGSQTRPSLLDGLQDRRERLQQLANDPPRVHSTHPATLPDATTKP